MEASLHTGSGKAMCVQSTPLVTKQSAADATLIFSEIFRALVFWVDWGVFATVVDYTFDI
jgi:hypothetical protein